MQQEARTMAQPQVLEGTGEELEPMLKRMPKQRFRLILLPGEEGQAEPPEPTQEERGQLLQFGMFPQLLALTEEDFQNAEWRGEDVDI
jgi:hypothetical protein